MDQTPDKKISVFLEGKDGFGMINKKNIGYGLGSGIAHSGFEIGLQDKSYSKHNVQDELSLFRISDPKKSEKIEAKPVFDSIIEELPDSDFTTGDLKRVAEKVTQVYYENKVKVSTLIDDPESLKVAVECWKKDSFKPAVDAGKLEAVANIFGFSNLKDIKKEYGLK